MMEIDLASYSEENGTKIMSDPTPSIKLTVYLPDNGYKTISCDPYYPNPEFDDENIMNLVSLVDLIEKILQSKIEYKLLPHDQHVAFI